MDKTSVTRTTVIREITSTNQSDLESTTGIQSTQHSTAITPPSTVISTHLSGSTHLSKMQTTTDFQNIKTTTASKSCKSKIDWKREKERKWIFLFSK